jgi:hypothetical protein
LDRADLERIFQQGDREALRAAARERLTRTLRFLVGRLYGEQGRQAARVLGWLTGDQELVSEATVVELMRRFVWSLNDESGAVPFGVPEAMAEIVLHRPELAADYVPILCSMLTSEEMVQTGVIERGIVWALGRLGPVVREHCPEITGVLRRMAESHADRQTREVAAEAARATGG